MCSTLAELVAVYLRWCETHYVKNGRRTRQYDNLKAMLNYLLSVEVNPGALEGRAPTRSYIDGRRTVRALCDVEPSTFVVADMEDYIAFLSRQKVRAGDAIAVNTVNKYRGWTIQFFGWAANAKRKLIDLKVHWEVKASDKIEPGRTPARRTSKVKPAKEEDVRGLIDFCRRRAASIPVTTVAARGRRKSFLLLACAMTIHWESGMRPGELVQMRPGDVLPCEEDPRFMVYEPGEYKTEHHDDVRRLFLTPAAVAAFDEACHLNRSDGWQVLMEFASDFTAESRLWPWKSDVVDVARGGYYQKMTTAIRLSGAKKYSPNRIRHAFATRSALVDLEGTRSQMGHRNLQTTRGYIDDDGQAARRLLGRLSGSDRTPPPALRLAGA